MVKTDKQTYDNACGENTYLEILQHMYDCHSVAQSLLEDITCFQASEDLVRAQELVCQHTECVYNHWV